MQPVILTVPATGYLEFDIEISWLIQNLTKYEMRFSESKAENIKGDYFPLFGFGSIGKGTFLKDKFVVYNPDSTGRDISLIYGDREINNRKLDSTVDSNDRIKTKSDELNFTTGGLNGNVTVAIGSVNEEVFTVNIAQFTESNIGTPTVAVKTDSGDGYLTTPFASTQNIVQSLFTALDHPFTVAGDETLECENGAEADSWLLRGTMHDTS